VLCQYRKITKSDRVGTVELRAVAVTKVSYSVLVGIYLVGIVGPAAIVQIIICAIAVGINAYGCLKFSDCHPAKHIVDVWKAVVFKEVCGMMASVAASADDQNPALWREFLVSFPKHAGSPRV